MARHLIFLQRGAHRVALHHWEEPFTMTKIAAKVQTLLNKERGATAVEYGLMVALIAVVIIAAVTLLGNNLSTTFNNVAKKV